MKKIGSASLNINFKRKFGVDFDGISAMSYVTLWTLKEALEQSSILQPETIREAIAALRLTYGPATITPLGYVGFDNNGQNKFKTLVTQIIDGRHYTVWPIELASRPVVWPAEIGEGHD